MEGNEGEWDMRCGDPGKETNTSTKENNTDEVNTIFGDNNLSLKLN